MKNFIKKSAFAVVLVALSNSAFATAPGAFFINANVGQSNFHDSYFYDHTDTSTAVRAGYAWHVGDAGNVGFEVGYANLGQATELDAQNFSNDKITVKLTGPVIGGNYKYTFRNKMFVSVRAGWFRSNFDVNYPAFGTRSFSGDGAYSGVGVGYDISSHFSLGVNFDEYHGRATMNGIKSKEGVSSAAGFVEYRF